MKQRRDAFFAIADESRRAILERLAREEDALPIAAIAEDFNITRSAIGKHIRVLAESGLVNTRFHGRENYISLDAERLAEVYQWISIFEEFWKRRLGKLKIMAEAKHKTHKR